jgi:hypothetical protein
MRLAALWPETIKAIRKQINARPEAFRSEWDFLVFLTRDGKPVQRVSDNCRAMTAAFFRLKVAAGSHRQSVSQRSTRHLFRTLADGAGDANAARKVMGHKIPGVEGRNIDSTDPERVKAVCEFVRAKFLSGKPKKSRNVSEDNTK